MDYYLLHTTYPVLFLSVFARQLCLPVPASLFLLSAGALAGAGRLGFAEILLVAVLGCLLGDQVWFEAGRWGGNRTLSLLCALSPDPIRYIRLARLSFARSGLILLLGNKFVPGLDGIVPPLAGMAGISRAKFLAFDAAGSAIWSAAYVWIGFVFAKQLEQVVRSVSAIAATVMVLLAVPLVFFFVIKLVKLGKLIKRMKPLHIAPAELKARMDAGETIAVIDLMHFEAEQRGAIAIPGAIQANPDNMRRKTRVVMPEGVDMVLYCGGKNNIVSARVAAAMHSKGVMRIRILEGGMAAWKAEGYPLSTEFADPSAEMKRLGVEMNPPWQA